MEGSLIKTTEEILASLLNNISDDYQKTIGFPTYDILNAVAMEFDLIYKKLEETEKSLDINNLTGLALERYIIQRKGITRKPATFATAILEVRGTGTIKVDDIFQTEEGLIFKSIEEKEIVGKGEITVKANIAGGIGNVLRDTIVLIPVAIPGIESVRNFQAASGGYDAEDDDSLRKRYLEALRRPATSGNKFHYEQWAKEVVGVGKVKVIPCHAGENTVKIIITNAENKPAEEELINKVQTYIDPGKTGEGRGTAPIGAKCTVVSADNFPLTISVKIRGLLDASLKKEIKKNIETYLFHIAFNQDFVSYAKIANAIINSKGVNDYEDLTINNGITNITVPENALATIGEINYV